MPTPKLSKPGKTLAAIIESEGGTILDIRKGGSHLKIDYTFDNHHAFTQLAPYGGAPLDRRFEHNFRAQVRRSKRQLETA